MQFEANALAVPPPLKYVAKANTASSTIMLETIPNV